MNLFLTVGAQMPFDRLVEAVDQWAKDHPAHDIVAQIGESELTPAHIEWRSFLQPAEFEAACDKADAMIGHAGIGTLFAALERGKPLLIMPRESARRETRNDHQIATARHFQERPGVCVAWDEDAVPATMTTLLARDSKASLSKVAGGQLVTTIAAFLDEL